MLKMHNLKLFFSRKNQCKCDWEGEKSLNTHPDDWFAQNGVGNITHSTEGTAKSPPNAISWDHCKQQSGAQENQYRSMEKNAMGQTYRGRKHWEGGGTQVDQREICIVGGKQLLCRYWCWRPRKKQGNTAAILLMQFFCNLMCLVNCKKPQNQ